MHRQTFRRNNHEWQNLILGKVGRSANSDRLVRRGECDFSGGGVPSFLYGVLETNWVSQDRTRIAGNDDPDTGGATLFLAPGLQYVSKKWIFEAAVQVPILQNLNGNALENEFTVRAGFRVNI